MSDLNNKVVIITGASGGIGGATAVEFARMGARLSLTGRNEGKLNEIKQRCIEAGLSDADVLTVIADLTKQDDIKIIVEKTIEKFKQIDVLVNNAGSLTCGDFQDTTAEMLDEMYFSNTKSVFCLSKAALPYLLERKGNIVNISSGAGTRPNPGIFAYSTSKAALNHMTQMMALELGPQGVRVNSVNPGYIVTDIFSRPGGHMSSAPDKIDQFYSMMSTVHPLQRIGKPEEVAKLILFLASGAAAFISGSIIAVDGGLHTTSATPKFEMSS